jgi:hypothetical protein
MLFENSDAEVENRGGCSDVETNLGGTTASVTAGVATFVPLVLHVGFHKIGVWVEHRNAGFFEWCGVEVPVKISLVFILLPGELENVQYRTNILESSISTVDKESGPRLSKQGQVAEHFLDFGRRGTADKLCAVKASRL